MNSLVNIDSELETLRNKRKDAIIRAFDGRTQQHISEKTNIHIVKLNKWINGTGNLESTELRKLNDFLGTSF